MVKTLAVVYLTLYLKYLAPIFTKNNVVMLSIYKVHFDEVIEVPKSSIKNFGLLIRKKRQVIGITQLELSKKAFGRSCRKYINMLEKGLLQNITFSTADKICQALNIELEFQVNEPIKEPQQLSFF